MVGNGAWGVLSWEPKDFLLSTLPHSEEASTSGRQHTALMPSGIRTFQLPGGGGGGKGRGMRLTLLPPPSDRDDLLSVVDIGRSAEVRGALRMGRGQRMHLHEGRSVHLMKVQGFKYGARTFRSFGES